MGAMPGHIGKGPILSRIDEFSRDPNRKDEFEQAATDLKNGLDMLTLGVKYDMLDPQNPAEKDHVDNLWFGNWWSQHQPIEPVARRAFEKAFKLSIDNGHLPLDCYWICVGARFEVTVALSASQVTVMIFTPPPPVSLYGFEFADLDDIWVVKHASAGYNPIGEKLERKDDTILTTQLFTGFHQ